MAEIEHKLPLPKALYEEPYNNTRRAKFIIFAECFNDCKEFQDRLYAEKIAFIRRIERACYNHAIDKANEENIISSWETSLFCQLYHMICYKVSANLNSAVLVGNNELIKRIISGTLAIQDLPRMTSQELYPEKYRTILERLEASKTVSSTLKTSTMYKCPLCKKSSCTIENRYNRSLDEGVNLTITCSNCSHQWNA